MRDLIFHLPISKFINLYIFKGVTTSVNQINRNITIEINI